MEICSICVTDIPKDAFKLAKNGKKYLNFVINKRKEVDKFGNDLTIQLSQTKEEKESKMAKVYIGQGKTFVFKNEAKAEPKIENGKINVEENPISEDDSLPF